MTAGALSRVRIVLVRPREPGNVGSAARVAANFGLGELVLVQPTPRRRYRPGGWKPGDPEPPPPSEPMTAHTMARAFAAGGVEMLERARIVDDLSEAIDDCVAAAAFTARLRVRREPIPRPPREVAPGLLASAARGPIALVFGPEDRGLTNRDLDRCNVLVHIPADPDYPVLNLAASVAVAVYELAAAQAAAAPPAAAADLVASLAEMERLYALFHRVLTRVRFLRGREMQGMVTLRGLLGRSGLQRRELNFLMGALTRIDQIVPGETPPPPGDEPE